ncbi:hypothetical protein P3G55_17690 [Leptospira sp. 96542]|nr:hypothetical protein [Leptospira sp. 96542]
MKKPSRLQKIFCLFLFNCIFIQAISCKLNLNNPSDPTSKSFFETFLWRLYLGSLCDPNLRSSVRLGTASYKTNPYQILKLKNGNFAVTAGVLEAVEWKGGGTTGKNFSFTGATGTDMNVILFVVNGSTMQIEWLDYLGSLSVLSDDKTTAPIAEFSNGDILVTALVNSSAQGNPISSKLNPNSLFMGRFSQNGNRVWTTYLDKTNAAIDGKRFALVIEPSDQIHLFFNASGTGSPDTMGFSEFPNMQVASIGSGHSEPGWAILNPVGSPMQQRYLPSTGEIQVLRASLTPNNSILVFGSGADNFSGFLTHPLAGYSYRRPMLAKLSIANFSIENVTFLGTNSTSHEVGTLSSITTGPDGVYTGGIASGGFGNPFHPFQLNFETATIYRNSIFSKFDWDGNLVWNQFLGSTKYDVVEIPPTIVYMQDSGSLKGNTLSPEDGYRFTGLSIPTFGDGSNLYQNTTLNISSSDGHYQSVHYESNFNTTPPSAGYFAQNNITDIAYACGGRLVRLKNVVELTTENSYIEITTRPANEEP